MAARPGRGRETPCTSSVLWFFLTDASQSAMQIHAPWCNAQPVVAFKFELRSAIEKDYQYPRLDSPPPSLRGPCGIAVWQSVGRLHTRHRTCRDIFQSAPGVAHHKQPTTGGETSDLQTSSEKIPVPPSPAPRDNAQGTPSAIPSRSFAVPPKRTYPYECAVRGSGLHPAVTGLCISVCRRDGAHKLSTKSPGIPNCHRAAPVVA